MGITKIKIDEFLQLAEKYPVIDVRSPGEFVHAHIPGASSLPLFSDEERKIVGTAYKQESREKAIKAGLDFFGVKMRKMVEEVEAIVSAHKQDHKLANANAVLVHCWRGGMRSAGVAWLLDLYGLKVYTLVGGYKAFRQWVLAQFEKQYPIEILGGYTGSGKTHVLQELARKGLIVVDLEAIARHKGSAFGDNENEPQPRQEMFENELAIALYNAGQKLNLATHASPNNAIWLEDESQRIGQLNLPKGLWKTMRSSPVYFLDIPFEKRLQHIVSEYGSIEKTRLVNAVIRIEKKLGGLDTKLAINHLLEGNCEGSFRILLRYYDKHYSKSLNSREDLATLLHTIPSDTTDVKTNTQKILNEKIMA